jgi:bifunctional enzyme CysN/CysC
MITIDGSDDTPMRDTRETLPTTAPAGGSTLWITGLPGAGKTTLAIALRDVLTSRGYRPYLLDGDELRRGLNSDLGFDRSARDENVRRVGEVAALLAQAGLTTIVSLISPYAAARDGARRAHTRSGLPFCEIYLDTPREVCEARDAKGHYAEARAGRRPDFTGIDAPYEEPVSPDLRVSSGQSDPVEQARHVLVSLGFGPDAARADTDHVVDGRGPCN